MLVRGGDTPARRINPIRGQHASQRRMPRGLTIGQNDVDSRRGGHHGRHRNVGILVPQTSNSRWVTNAGLGCGTGGRGCGQPRGSQGAARPLLQTKQASATTGAVPDPNANLGVVVLVAQSGPAKTQPPHSTDHNRHWSAQHCCRLSTWVRHGPFAPPDSANSSPRLPDKSLHNCHHRQLGPSRPSILVSFCVRWSLWPQIPTLPSAPHYRH